MKILITGGAGFIGSALVRYIIANTNDEVINVDKLSYSSNLKSLAEVVHNKRYVFEKHDVCDMDILQKIFAKYQPDAVMHLAAESHVDTSISTPDAFIKNNILGTYCLLQVARDYWDNLDENRKNTFRFHQISTDEVYGELLDDDNAFTELSQYKPSNPYSASKASSDHLVRAWYRTYGLPIVITNCSNNYGPFQHEEKLIPKMILRALSGKTLTIYGDGCQKRDWLFVDDHVSALYKVVVKGKVGETYNIGSHNEKTNIEVVQSICSLLEELKTTKPRGVSYYSDLILYVEDRPGHDARYAVNSYKVTKELGWRPRKDFDIGLRETVEWYMRNFRLNGSRSILR